MSPLYLFFVEFSHLLPPLIRTVASLKAAAPKIISSSEELTKMKLSRFRMEKLV